MSWSTGSRSASTAKRPPTGWTPDRARCCAAERRRSGPVRLAAAAGDRRDPAPVFEVDGARRSDSGPDPPTQRAAQDLEGTVEFLQSEFGDLVLLDHDAGQRLVVQGPTVEQEAH